MDLISGNLIITKIQNEAYYENYVYVTITGSKQVEAFNGQLITLNPSSMDLIWKDSSGNTGKFTYDQSIGLINFRFDTTDLK